MEQGSIYKEEDVHIVRGYENNGGIIECIVIVNI